MGINKESGRVEFGIKVLDSTKCYYCGRKGKEISDILKKMSNEIDHGINAIKDKVKVKVTSTLKVQVNVKVKVEASVL